MAWVWVRRRGRGLRFKLYPPQAHCAQAPLEILDAPRGTNPGVQCPELLPSPLPCPSTFCKSESSEGPGGALGVAWIWFWDPFFYLKTGATDSGVFPALT